MIKKKRKKTKVKETGAGDDYPGEGAKDIGEA